MNTEKTVSGSKLLLPRLVFDKAGDKGYRQRVCHADFTEKDRELFARVRREFEWPEKFIGSGRNTYPDCYGLYCAEKGRFLLVRFRDGGCDEHNRPHSVAYEVFLYRTPDEGTRDPSASLAALLDPRAWTEPDDAIFMPVGVPDCSLTDDIHKWLAVDKEKLYLHIPHNPSPIPQPRPIPASISPKKTRWMALGGRIILVLAIVGVGAWYWAQTAFFSEAQNTQILQRKVEELTSEYEELLRAKEKSDAQLRNLTDRLRKIREISDSK